MTIAVSILIMMAALAFALVASLGLPETMRWLALWLIVKARRIEEWRREKDHETRHVLSVEVR